MAPLIRPPTTILGLSPTASAYLGAALVAVGMFLLRLLLQPILHSNSTYSFSYLTVIIAAYAFGRRPAALATLVAAFVAFFCFTSPQFAWKSTPQAFTSLSFFLLNSAVVVYVISGLTRSLAALAAEQGRAQAVANSHADLFRELNERISHHLRLVAGVLTLQAKGEPEPDVMRGLRKASERSVMMARVHRELAGGTEEPVDFDAFARGLARSVCHARGEPTERVTVDRTEIWLPPEEATSLGVALVECISALLARKDAAPLRIRILPGAAETRVAISEIDEASGAALTSLSSGYLLRAMVEQLGAGVSLRADGHGSSLELAVPHAGASRPVDAEEGAVGTVH
jgi:two-component sensor histidine kinase